MDLSYILNELGEERGDYLNSVVPPVFESSIFCFDSFADLREGLKDELETPFYTRGHNPTVAILRRKLAALESAEDSLVFASGSAAVAGAILPEVGAGDHVVCVQKPYSWTGVLLDRFLHRFGVETTFVDGSDTDAVERAMKRSTRVLMLESPNSITFELQDIERCAELARDRGITTVCDNSYATPLNQRPLELGVDIVVHSASKYLNGHSDVVAGVLCGSRDRIRRIFEGPFMTLGGVIGPFEAWLMLRGLRTLPVRLDRIARTTEKVVEFLAAHPAVEHVHYPQHDSHPQHDLARRSLSGGNGLFSMRLAAEGIGNIERFCNSLKRFLIACSWGGYESLVYPMAALVDSENYKKSRSLPWNLVRLSIGLEDPDVLIEDLEQALEGMS